MDNKVSRAYERFMEGPRRTPFQAISAPFRPIGRLLIWLLYLAGIFFGIWLIFFVVTAGGRAQQTGLLETIYTKTDVAISQTPILNIVQDSVKTLLKFRDNPETILTQPSWKTEIDKSETNAKLGLKFRENLKPFRDRYDIALDKDKKIELKTSYEFSSLKDKTSIRFLCDIKDFPKGKTIEVEPNGEVIINKDEIKIDDVICKVPVDAFPTLPAEQTVVEKKVKLYAIYNFESKVYQSIWTIPKENLNPKDPFEGVNDPDLNKQTRQTIPHSSKGPMLAKLKFQITQPLTENPDFSKEGTYNLGLRLEKSSVEWQGQLNEIDNVYLYLPKNFELVDDRFIKATDASETNSEDKYQMRQEEIDKLNNQCNLYYGGKDSQECNDLLQNGFNIAFTKFRIINIEKQTLFKNYVRVEVDYNFQAETIGSFTLIKSSLS